MNSRRRHLRSSQKQRNNCAARGNRHFVAALRAEHGEDWRLIRAGRGRRCAISFDSYMVHWTSRREVMSKRGGGRLHLPRMTLIITSLALLHVLAGCSSSLSSGSNQAAAVPPPRPPTAAGQPSYGSASQPVHSPPGSGVAAGTSPSVADLAYDLMPYPKQSLVDIFRGPTEPQVAAIPHPPSTYTASGQPYSPPPGQSVSGVPAGAAPTGTPPTAPSPQANADPSDYLPYPKQSLFDLFSNKQGAQ